MGIRRFIYLLLILVSGAIIVVLTTDVGLYIREHWVSSWPTGRINFWQKSGQDMKATFSVLSYNIWFATQDIDERMKVLSDLISELKPDFIAFQEVTTVNLKVLRTFPWFSQYNAHYSRDNLEGYFVAIFVHTSHSVERWKALPTFESSRLARNLLWVETKLNSSVGFEPGEHFTLGTAHLESLSLLMASKAREKQLGEVLTVELNQFSNVCFTGDLNIDDIDGVVTLPGDWKDAWLETGRTDEQGYTWNGAINHYAKAQGDPIKARYDRILCKLRNFELKDIQVVGSLPTKNNEKVIFASDHFGIFATFAPTSLPVKNDHPGPLNIKFDRPMNQ